MQSDSGWIEKIDIKIVMSGMSENYGRFLKRFFQTDVESLSLKHTQDTILVIHSFLEESKTA